jgi:superfamily I DNA and/or RNA helicase
VEALLHDVEATRRAGAELSGTSLVEILLEDNAEAKAKAQELTIAEWIKQYRRDCGKPDYGNLNETQRQAIQLMLSEPISLIQGPPGTGKTSTIVAAIRMLKQHYDIPHPILLTSYTNVAVDNLAQGCKDAGLNVIRAGYMVRVRESLNDITVEGLLEKHPSKPRLDEMEASKIATVKAIQSLRNPNEAINNIGEEGIMGDLEDDIQWLEGESTSDDEKLARLKKNFYFLHQRCYALRREMEAEIFKGVDVVCCTALSAPSVRVIDFPLVFFDEATMATEPVTIATMIKGCQQMSLIGDQQQLSPLIKSRQVIEEGLGLSLFERLMDRGDLKSVMLNMQHRMHPNLFEYPNSEFYGGRLLNAESTDLIKPIQSSYMKSGNYLSFVDHQGNESVTRNKSLENHREASIVVKIIADLLCKNGGMSGSDIGVVTPYLGQKEELARSLQDPTSPARALFALEVAKLGGSKSCLKEVADVEIHTIESMEGREKKAIIFSLVRSNKSRYLGFLQEEKRCNVALTRAKNALFIVGNLSMLQRGKERMQAVTSEEEDDVKVIEEEQGREFLSRLADHLQEKDCIIAADKVEAGHGPV